MVNLVLFPVRLMGKAADTAAHCLSTVPPLLIQVHVFNLNCIGLLYETAHIVCLFMYL